MLYVVHSKLLSTSLLFLIEAFKQDQGVSLKCVFYCEFLSSLSMYVIEGSEKGLICRSVLDKIYTSRD